jgi:hypothetical protein
VQIAFNGKSYRSDFVKGQYGSNEQVRGETGGDVMRETEETEEKGEWNQMPRKGLNRLGGSAPQAFRAPGGAED